MFNAHYIHLFGSFGLLHLPLLFSRLRPGLLANPRNNNKRLEIG